MYIRRYESSHCSNEIVREKIFPFTPLAESVNRVGGFLVYRDVKKGRYVYILITKYCKGEVAKYDVLKKSIQSERTR